MALEPAVVKELGTERLRLERWTVCDGDIDFLFDLYSRWKVQRFIGRQPRVIGSRDPEAVQGSSRRRSAGRTPRGWAHQHQRQDEVWVRVEDAFHRRGITLRVVFRTADNAAHTAWCKPVSAAQVMPRLSVSAFDGISVHALTPGL